uniref:Uncharacterized protein n=1 Tax=Meleagris gallopavo TaxID=9103 RepID=A0A803YKX2_MELGA
MELIEDCRVLSLCCVLGLWDLWVGLWDVSILTASLAKLLPNHFLRIGLITSWYQSGHWLLPRTKRFGVWPWEDNPTLLIMSFLFVYFAEKQIGKLGESSLPIKKKVGLSKLSEKLGESSLQNQKEKRGSACVSCG